MGVPWGIRRFRQTPTEVDLAEGRALAEANFWVNIPGPEHLYSFRRLGWEDDGSCAVEVTQRPGGELLERLAGLRFSDGTREEWEALRGWADGRCLWHGADDLKALERHAAEVAVNGATESLRTLAAEVEKAAALAGRNWMILDISS